MMTYQQVTAKMADLLCDAAEEKAKLRARVAELEAENARLREALSDIASGFSCLQGFSGVDAVAMVVRALGEGTGT